MATAVCNCAVCALLLVAYFLFSLGEKRNKKDLFAMGRVLAKLKAKPPSPKKNVVYKHAGVKSGTAAANPSLEF